MAVRASVRNYISSVELRLRANFTQRPNAFLETLARTHLSPYESRVIFFIMRKTYGWKKLTDWIALSQLVEGTGIAKPNICRTLNSLRRRRIIIRPDRKHVGIHPDHRQWQQTRTKHVLQKA